MGRANFAFAGVCAVLLAVATVAVAGVEGLPIRDPDGVAVPTYVRLPIILALAWLIDVVPRAVRRSRTGEGSWWLHQRAVISERWNRDHVVFAVSGLAAWYVCYAAFRNLKGYVPFVNGRLHDDLIARIDHALWLGHDPADVLHGWFGTNLAASFFSFVYIAWIVLIPVSLAIALVWTRHPAAGSWFVTAVALDWVLGVAAYFMVPTLGPIYSDAGMFADLKHTFTTTLEADLLSDRLEVLADPGGTHAVQTIAAFPSLHVGMMVTVCLFVRLARLARWIQLSSWVFLVLTVLATIYLGWHFSVDAIGGAVVGTAAVWLAAIGTGNHANGIPRLTESADSYAESPASAMESRSA